MIRFYNGLVMTMADGCTEPVSAEVWTDGDKICYVGPEKADMPKFEREINLHGNLLMPGFKNAHTHTAMTFVRSYADDLPLQDWLFGKIIPLEGKLTESSITAFTKLGIMEYLTSGITASFDMYYMRAPYVQANLDMGFRTCICGGSAAYDLISREYKTYNSCSPLIKYIPGIHSEYTTSQEEFEAVQQLCRENKAPCFAHNSETALEVEECKGRRNGMTPTEYMESLGLFEYGGGGFHCVWLSENDKKIFRDRGLWAITCPGSNSKLASGVMPLTDYMNDGLNLAIGTDGASSNNALDMFREMYLACVLQKLEKHDPAVCPADKVLAMATTGGARAMGLADCDCIAAGKQADMIVIDMDRPSMQPVLAPAKNLVYSGSKDVVKLTMVAGKILYENGQFLTCDKDEVYADVRRELDKILCS